jgi:hypothetical protein
MPSTANAVKNSVLFALLILIVHVIAKNNASASASAAAAAAHAGTATARARPERTQRAAPVPAAEPEEDEEDPFERPDAANAADSADLLEYVFGKKEAKADAKADGHESTTSFGSKDAFNGSSKASNEQVVVGKYDNESVMCGGPLFGGGLECFDGAGSSYQLL